MTLTDFNRMVYAKHAEYAGNLRIGQVVYMVLDQFDRESARAINGTAYDCFYDDKTVPRTYEWLITHGVLTA